MSTPLATADRPIIRFVTASLARELGIMLALSILFPFLIHVLPVPETARLGPRLLPMFYAPLLATLIGRRQTAWLVALLAPWLNWAITSHPSPAGALVMTVELLVFVAVLPRLFTPNATRGFASIPAYLVGMAAATAAAAWWPTLIGGQPAVDWAVRCVVTGLPGVAIMVLLTLAVLRWYPPGAHPHGGGPAPA